MSNLHVEGDGSVANQAVKKKHGESVSTRSGIKKRNTLSNVCPSHDTNVWKDFLVVEQQHEEQYNK